MCFENVGDDDDLTLSFQKEISLLGDLRQKHSRETRDTMKRASASHICSKMCLSRINCFMYINGTVVPKLVGFFHIVLWFYFVFLVNTTPIKYSS